MRNNKEVADEVRRRVDELRTKSARRRNRLYVLASGAACLALVVGLAVLLPGLVPEATRETAGLYSGTLIVGSSAGGYVLVGVVAFVLGAAATPLCLRFFNRKR